MSELTNEKIKRDLEKMEEDIKYFKEEFEKGDAHVPLISVKNQMVYFDDKKVKANTTAYYLEDKPRDIGIIFTNGYYWCEGKRQRFIEEANKLNEKFQDGVTIEDKEELDYLQDLEYEIEYYRMLEVLTNFFINNLSVPAIVMEYCFAFLNYEYIPQEIHGYGETGLVRYPWNPCEDFEEYISDVDNLKPFKTIAYCVSNELQFCMAMLDYIQSKGYMLRKCSECNRFYIADHGNQVYCSDSCREVAQRKMKDKSESEPIRKAWKKAYLRIHNRTRIANLKASDWFESGSQIEKRTQEYIDNEDKALLLGLLKDEYDSRVVLIHNKEDEIKVINWLNKIGRKNNSSDKKED